MAGIYIHIPFCKQACHYCDFHFSTTPANKNALLNALLQEIPLRSNYLLDEKIDTIYFGGGTPSLLTAEEINKLLEAISKHFNQSKYMEITLESNPDDLSLEKIKSYKDTPVNRLSIGIQSFLDEDLRFMNRAHSARQATSAVENVIKAGFYNISIDLIYGTPTMNNNQWRTNLKQAFEFNIPHISSYCLTVEANTALYSLIKKGKVQDVNQEDTVTQFNILMAETSAQGYEHYEISNFAKPGFESKHNSGYWSRKKYIGLGPSAHSYNGTSRQWNVANNIKYLKSLQNGEPFFEKEELNESDLFNEYVMTSLRTKHGINIEWATQEFPEHFILELNKNVSELVNQDLLTRDKNLLILTPKGKLIADKIISDLFILG